ncbi:hypothetical protein MMC17_008866 [Xylographa soralifera]|nr:hypothetical protein [Xylographa soralifera]
MSPVANPLGLLLFGWTDVVDVGIEAGVVETFCVVVEEEIVKVSDVEAKAKLEVCIVRFSASDDDKDEGDAGVDADDCKDDGRAVYIVESSLGGGAENVSSVGYEQLAEPSEFVLQQRQI